jgi:dTDP-4-amino-4,6-dideoxygalactose transaminase
MAPVPLFDTNTQIAPLRGRIEQAMRRVVDSGRFILGPEGRAFEAEFAEYVGATHAVGVGNGTDALMIALRALGVGPGDEVIVPSFTFYASAEAIPAIGARPVFCDVDPETFNVTPESVASVLTLRTKAVIAVHLFGAPAPVPQLMGLAAEHGFKVLEDAAQAVGARLDGAAAGALGHAATFSFFPSKNLGAFGDGGMITTGDAEVARLAERLRHHGSTDKRKHDLIGYNSRLDELQAAILRVLLPELDGWNSGRRQAAAWYDEAGIAELAVPQSIEDGCEPVYHLYVVSHENADEAASKLADSGVEARGYYRKPIHKQPAFHGVADHPLPGTDLAAARNLALPMSPTITRDEVQKVVKALRRAAPA